MALCWSVGLAVSQSARLIANAKRHRKIRGWMQTADQGGGFIAVLPA